MQKIKQDGRAIRNKSFQNNLLNSHLASQIPTAYNSIHKKNIWYSLKGIIVYTVLIIMIINSYNLFPKN